MKTVNILPLKRAFAALIVVAGSGLAQANMCLAEGGSGMKLFRQAASLANNIETRPTALNLIEQAITHEPNNSSYYLLKATILQSMEEAEEALPVINKALSLNSQEANIWEMKGTILSDLKNFKEALICIDRSLKISPDYAPARRAHAHVLMKLNRLDEALADLKISLKKNNKPPERILLERDALHCAIHLKEWKFAADQASALIAAHQDNNHTFSAYHDRATARTALKQYQPALADLATASKLQPFNSALHLEMAAIYKSLGQADQVKLEQKQAEVIGSEWAPGRNLGR